MLYIQWFPAALDSFSLCGRLRCDVQRYKNRVGILTDCFIRRGLRHARPVYCSLLITDAFVPSNLFFVPISSPDNNLNARCRILLVITFKYRVLRFRCYLVSCFLVKPLYSLPEVMPISSLILLFPYSNHNSLFQETKNGLKPATRRRKVSLHQPKAKHRTNQRRKTLNQQLLN